MQRESHRVPRVLGEEPEGVEDGPMTVSRGSRESQETFKRESGDGPMRVREAPEKVRKGSREC